MSTTTFVWKGTTPQGEPMSGEYEAEQKQEVAAYLRKRKIAVRSIRQKPREIKFNLGAKKGVSVKDMSVFTRQFSTMINAGLPIVQCLDILSRQTENERLRAELAEWLPVKEFAVKHKDCGITYVLTATKHESSGKWMVVLCQFYSKDGKYGFFTRGGTHSEEEYTGKDIELATVLPMPPITGESR